MTPQYEHTKPTLAHSTSIKSPLEGGQHGHLITHNNLRISSLTEKYVYFTFTALDRKNIIWF